MADRDYQKTLKDYFKTRKDNRKKHADVLKKVEKAKLRAKSLKQMFLQAAKDIERLGAEVDRLHNEWGERAETLIEIQANIKKAVKAKDRDEVAKLQKEAQLVHNVASAISERTKATMQKLEMIKTIHESNHHELEKIS